MNKALGAARMGVLATAAVFGFECDRGAPPKLDTEVSTHALTGVDVDRVLGFENPTADWTVVEGGQGTITSSTDHTQGQRSLSINARNYVPIRSAALTSLGTRVGRTLLFDLELPVQQPNPYWFGATQCYLDLPSKNLNNYYLGQVELTGSPVGRWFTIAFDLSDDVLAKLTSAYSDLRIKIALNVPYNATGAYKVDNLRMASGIGNQVTLTAQLGCGGTSGYSDGHQSFSSAAVFRIPPRFPPLRVRPAMGPRPSPSRATVRARPGASSPARTRDSPAKAIP